MRIDKNQGATERTANDILLFWFQEAGPSWWFKKDDAFDARIRETFETTAIGLAAKVDETPHAWEATPDSALAMIIALDQFPRNMYRGTPAAFAWDWRARTITNRLLERGGDLKLAQAERPFAYMPLMHSENLSDQSRCVDLMDQRVDNPSNLEHAISHKRVIEQFGRFPHRNEILGRASTPDEIRFLQKGGYAP